MHDYLRAIGFSKVTNRREMQRLLDMAILNPSQSHVSTYADGTLFSERSRDFARGVGLTVRGELDETGRFIYDYYFPHYNGDCPALTEDVVLEKLSEREEYHGVCDVANLGVNLIFHMNHQADYEAYMEEKLIPRGSVCLSALSISAKVLIPLLRTEDQDKKKRKELATRRSMIAAARQGDQDALENLTLEDMDLYSMISKRIKKEDILSIVESSFMPYGIASDQYSIIGDIVSCTEIYNQVTGEKLYQMLVQCSDLMIDVCMNAEDLLGEPMEGRRFKGNIWLQGQLEA